MSDGFQLAEFNMAPARYPLDDPRMAEFVEALDRINGLAARSPGFIWRLVSDDAAATVQELFGDPRLLMNLSVWSSVEQLFEFVFRSEHTEFWKRGESWFAEGEEQRAVLWWIPEGTQPTVEEAVARLKQLRTEGPTPEAFTFRRRFPRPN